MSALDYVWFAFAGLATGVINTLAGSGSLITLPVFMFLCGLPAPVANGTNRVGVLLQSLVGAFAFQQKDPSVFSRSGWALMPAVLGAIAGSSLAVDIAERTMNYFIGGLMVFMLLVLLFKPSRWLSPKPQTAEASRPNKIWSALAFFFIGVYGGFIQAGVGIFLLAGMVLVSRMDLKKSNALKVLAVGAFNLPALVVFALHDQVVWSYGLLMAVFQAAGAWVAVNVLHRIPDAEVWTYRLLVLVVAASAIKIFVAG